MPDTQEFARNLTYLRKCRKIYTVIFFYSIVSSLILILYGFINLVSISPDMLIKKVTDDPDNLMSPNFFVLFLDALIIAPLALYFGLRISVSQHDLSAVLNIALLTGNMILFFVKRDWDFFHRVPISFAVFTIFCVAGIFFSALGLKSNYRYHWLEEQEGFPHFSEHLAEYEMYGKNWEEFNPFIAESERRKKFAQDHMDEVPELSADKLEELYGIGSAAEKHSNIKLSGHKDK